MSAAVTAPRLESCALTTARKIVTTSEITGIVAQCRSRGERVALTNGCFDLLHVGHVRLLAEARALADILVVGINSDASVLALKGPPRPYVSQDERAEMLAAFGCVDFVVVFSDPDPCALVEAIRPAFHVKGAEYAHERAMPEAKIVKQFGGQLHFAAMQPARGTTRLVEMIRKQ